MTVVMAQSAKGNAAKAGIKEGDTVIYTSSFFGDELWPSDDLQFTRSALAAAPSPVFITFVSPITDGGRVVRDIMHLFKLLHSWSGCFALLYWDKDVHSSVHYHFLCELASVGQVSWQMVSRCICMLSCCPSRFTSQDNSS